MDMYKHRIFIRLSLKGQFWNSGNVDRLKLSNIEQKCMWAVHKHEAGPIVHYVSLS